MQEFFKNLIRQDDDDNQIGKWLTFGGALAGVGVLLWLLQKSNTLEEENKSLKATNSELNEKLKQNGVKPQEDKTTDKNTMLQQNSLQQEMTLLKSENEKILKAYKELKHSFSSAVQTPMPKGQNLRKSAILHSQQSQFTGVINNSPRNTNSQKIGSGTSEKKAFLIQITQQHVELENYQKEIKSLKSLLTQNSEKLSELEKKNALLIPENQEQRSQIEKLNQTILELQRANSEFTQQLEVEKQNTEAEKKKVVELQEKNNVQEKSILQLKEESSKQVIEHQKQIESWKETSNKSSQKIMELEETNASLTSEEENLTLTLKNLNHEHQKKLQLLEVQTQQNSELTLKFKALQEQSKQQIENQKEEIELLKNGSQKSSQEFKQLKEKNTALDSELKELKKTHQLTLEQLEAQKRLVEERIQENSELTEKDNILQKSNTELEQLNKKQLQQIELLKKDSQELIVQKETNTSLSSELEKLTSTHKETSQQLEAQKLLVEERTQENSELTQNIDKLEKQSKLDAQKQQEEIETLTKKSEEASLEFEQLKEKNTALTSELEKLKSTHQLTLEQLNDQKQLVEIKNKEKLELTEKIRLLENPINKQPEKLNSNTPYIPPRKNSTFKITDPSAAETLQREGLFPKDHNSITPLQKSTSSTPKTQTKQPQNKGQKFIEELTVVVKKEKTPEHEKEFANYVIFLLALHKHDKTITQIMSEAKKFLANELNIIENDIPLKFPTISSILNTIDNTKEITIGNHAENTPYSLSESEVSFYHSNLKRGENGLSQNLMACHVFGNLWANFTKSTYGKCEEYPNGFVYTKKDYKTELKGILIELIKNLTTQVDSMKKLTNQ